MPYVLARLARVKGKGGLRLTVESFSIANMEKEIEVLKGIRDRSTGVGNE